MAANVEKFQDEFDEPEEPSVTSTDPNERKLARRLRIQRRLEALKKQDGTEEDEIVDKTPTEKQILASAELLDKLALEEEEVISNVRVANDAREVQRRRDEKEIRDKLLAMLEKEADESAKKYHEINAKWATILSSNDPLDIHDQMEAQNAECLKILAEKDAVIVELKKELENADLKFIQDQSKQNDDVNVLIERIDNQVNTMVKAYRRELALIESVIESERKVILATVTKKWESLYKQRNENEINGIEQRKEIMKEYDIEMKKVTMEHQEEFRAQKILLETEYQTLQQEFEHIKALCTMNIEKLDYNYAVLKRREDENIIIKSQQKRRINKLQDAINGLKKNYTDLEENTKLEIQRLTEQVVKARKTILELEEKSNHFTNVNEKQYLKIWDMNAKSADELVNKILTVDRVIHEQVLGLEWEPPEKPLLRKEDLPSYCGAICAIDQKKAKVNESPETHKSQKEVSSLQEVNSKRRLLHHVMGQISDHSGFLIENRLRELLEPYTISDKLVIRLDNIFQAFNIKSEDEIDVLLNFFLPYCYCPTCEIDDNSTSTTYERENELLTTEPSKERYSDASGEINLPESNTENNSALCAAKDSEDSTIVDSDLKKQDNDIEKGKLSCDKGHTLVTRSVYVMKALRRFITKYHATKQEDAPMSFQDKLTEQKISISRNLTVEDVTKFWRRYKEVFPTNKEKLWDGLLIGLQKYHGILKERHKLNVETERLRKQNSELRRLLEAHMSKPESNLPPLKLKSANVTKRKEVQN